jgi:hypothetical protein
MAQGTTVQRTCGKSAFINAATGAATSQLAPNPLQAPFAATPTVGGVAPGTPIYLCGYVLVVATGGTAALTYGVPASLPGTGCGASPVPITPAYGPGTIVDNGGGFLGLVVPAGNNLCVTVTGATAAQVLVYYDNNPL